MITLKNGNMTYNVEEICYKPYIIAKPEEIEGRRFVSIYTSPKVFVLKLIGNISEMSLHKLFIEIIDRNPGSDSYVRFNLKEPNLIEFTEDNKLIIEVNSWVEEFIDK